MSELVVPDSPRAIELVQARFYTPANRNDGDVLWCVWHDAEAAADRLLAEHLGAWWHGPQSAHTSAHYGIDLDSIVQYVLERDIAWACGHTGNLFGISVELEGFASRTAEEWLADEGTLRQAVELGACISRRRRIPVTWLTVEEARARKPGHLSHRTLSKAFGESGHTDLGEVFEAEVAPIFMGRMQRVLEAA